MKIIDWNRPLTFLDLFDNISIHSINNNCFNQNNPTWISSVTHDFGTEADIANNLLTLFKKRVGALRCYHATRLFFPKKIYREGLKILSSKLVIKLCKQAGYSPKKNEKEIILKNYNDYISIISDGRRKHIYVQLDKYRDMLCKENCIKEHCSFFSGGEVFNNVLPPSKVYEFLNILKLQGIPTLVYIDLPISDKYINDKYLIKIANTFFCSWFNSKILKNGYFRNGCGLNIPIPIY